MKKTLVIIVSILTLTYSTTICRAQEKFKASISMGPVFPLGEFKSADINSAKAGYAQSGFTLNVDGDYFINNQFSFSMRFHFGNASINQSGNTKQLYSGLKKYYNTSDTTEYDISFWQWASPQIGCKFHYPLVVNKLYLEAGAFTGISINQIPDQNAVYKDVKKDQLVISQNDGNNDISMPLSLCAGCRIQISKTMQCKVNLEYFRTNITYSHSIYTQSSETSNKTFISGSDYKIPIQTFDASIGLVYSF
ncbi:MAG TPA: hypothetical protein PKH79_10000 [Prolixibacteraceae bacterium]|nr:hypothetical protein [Prolixibacteraceae bacterium]